MAFHKTIVFACMAVCAVYGTSANNVPVGPNIVMYNVFGLTSDPECQQERVMTCVAPLMAFAMSPEGHPLQQHWVFVLANISQIITEDIFTRLCSIAQTVLPCAEAWMNKCAPPELKALTKLQFKALGTILSPCNETDSYSKFTKAVNCGRRISDSRPAMTCINTVGQSGAAQYRADVEKHIDNSSAALSEWQRNPTKYALKKINVQKYTCCYGKMGKDCLAPVLESVCTPEEKSVTENFMDRILHAYECTEDLYRCERLPGV